ncbi:sigma-B regulation protein RsbU (phosphoserine phosphatase) [Sphingomonas zeicaulis]|uniref:PAS domain-containing sensor histidine kinase n=1 Tax=Sphingomonas zeicaulis TaxID=1632740 RepID=UPI003D1EA0B2
MSEPQHHAAPGAVTINFEDLFETAPCGYLLADRDGRLIRANRTFANWVGVRPENLVGKRLPDLLTIPGKIFYETHFAPTLRMRGQLNEIALEIATSGQQKLPVLVNANESRGDRKADSLVRFAVFLAAERRGYEQGLLNARDKAEATIVSERADSELREQFIAVLGHDLRNPLASITSGIHMLAKETLSERGRKVVALMGGSVVRAAGLIDNVMDFARGRLGGGITLARDASEPLEPVLRQVVSELRSISPDQEIVAHYSMQEPIVCDRMRIGQLLSNLLGNALTHGAKDQPVRVDATTSLDELVIAVSNGGTPIPPPAIEKLFQPFFRGHDRARQGLGLGLHIASEIARAHDGTLVARSDEVATTFIFTMPLPNGGFLAS